MAALWHPRTDLWQPFSRLVAALWQACGILGKAWAVLMQACGRLWQLLQTCGSLMVGLWHPRADL